MKYHHLTGGYMKVSLFGPLVAANVMLAGALFLVRPAGAEGEALLGSEKCCVRTAEGACVCAFACSETSCANSTMCTVEKMCAALE